MQLADIAWRVVSLALARIDVFSHEGALLQSSVSQGSGNVTHILAEFTRDEGHGLQDTLYSSLLRWNVHEFFWVV